MARRFQWFICFTLLLAGLQTAVAQTEDDGIVIRTLRILEPPPPAPLTASEKFHQYLMNSLGPFPDLGEAASAGLSQWVNSPPEWGQGATGYGRRFGNNVAYNVIRNTLSYGISIPTHEDIRYFASGKTTTRGRIVHALLSPVTVRREDGSDGFSYSNTTGIVGANLIALAWAPPSWRTPGSFASGVGWSYGGTAALNLAREFVPDLIRRIRR